jgi:hypothetical protein
MAPVRSICDQYMFLVHGCL